MSSQKLWVQRQTAAKTFIDKISTEGCEDIADFLKEIKREFEIPGPTSAITIYKSDGMTEIDVGDSLTDYLNGNSRATPLIVKSMKIQTIELFLACGISFYSNIFNAKDNDGWLMFTENIPSLKLNRLFVRDSFQYVAECIVSNIYPLPPSPSIESNTEPARIASSAASSIERTPYKAIITGTPGIGKSLFLIYLLWNLVKARKRVLFIYHPDTIYYDGNGGVFELTSLPLVVDHSFWTSDLWCLFDAKAKKEEHLNALPYEVCQFVLSTSPRRELINDFKKSADVQFFFMPTWTEKELETISCCFPAVIGWKDRFEILGGIPRHVLEITQCHPRKILEDACKQCDLDDCIKIVGWGSTITDKSKVVHSLVHIISGSPFIEPSVKFASETALDIIVRNKGTEAKRKLEELLESCEGNPLTAALCGYIFEHFALELLEKGGTFTCRKLVHGNKKAKPDETTLTIPSSVKLVVDKVLLNQTCNQLHLPKTKNYAAIDAWIPGIGAFQITVGKKHDIKGDARDDLAKLGEEANKLYWLLPPLYYHSFTKKTPLDIEQYAVRIPYPTVKN